MKHITMRDAVIRIAGTITSALLLIFSSPGLGAAHFAWVALLPIILACQKSRSTHAFLLGFFFGLISTVGIFHWIFAIEGFGSHHGLILAIYLALYPAVWCAALPYLSRTGPWLLITGPCLWVLLEYARAHAGFMALPWAGLAHSQYRNTALIQLAAFTGEQGVSFLVVMANLALARVVGHRRWRASAATLTLIIAMQVLGAASLDKQIHSMTLKVTVIQPAILRHHLQTAAGRDAALERLVELSRRPQVSNTELIVWPENAVPDLQTHITVYEQIRSLAQELGAPVITGASEFEKFPSAESYRAAGHAAYNVAYFVNGESPPSAPYRKRLLVPFGEYVPLQDLIRWPEWLVPERFSLQAGQEFHHFTLRGGLRVSPIICWENLFAGFVRSLALERPDLIVQLTNDNWFGRSAAPYQHNAASVFRAVENHTPIAVASNTGPALLIDPRGMIIAEGPKSFISGAVTAEAPLQSGMSLYTILGDWFVVACLLSLIAAAIGGIFNGRNDYGHSH